MFRLTVIALFFSLLTGLILYARGFRVSLSKKNLLSTGILVAASYPDGAKIYVNGDLKGATNSNLTLPPGAYLVEIKKEGYSSWSKNIRIKGEIVIKADALLFPQNPALSPITSLGVVKSYFSEKNTNLIIFSQMGDPTKDGLYLLETSKKAISIFNPLKLLVLKSLFPADVDFAKTAIRFSPDGRDIMVSFFDKVTYLISTSQETKELFDITQSKTAIEESWNEQETKTLQKILTAFADPLPQIASDSFDIVSFSPNQSKILYQAKKSTDLPLIMKPPLIGTNQTLEQRKLQKDYFYVYDKKEDKNFVVPMINPDLIGINCPSSTKDCLLWYPDSSHLAINEGKQIAIIDYDGSNKRTVYSGPYESGFWAVASDGRILLLANLNPGVNKLPDVYAVDIR